MMRAMFLLIAFFLMSCAGSYPQHQGNSQLVVQYEGKTEHTRGYSGWVKPEDLQAYLSSTGKKYLIFAAPWCKSCSKLKRLLKQEKLDHAVVYLNVDQTWAFLLSKKLGVEGVPTLIEVDGPKVSEPIAGMDKVLMRILIHVNPQNSK